VIYSKHTIRQLIIAIDAIVKEQVVAILDHGEFRGLLENWSCLYYLVNNTKHATTKIKILDLKWGEISNLLNEGNMLDNLLSYKILDELELQGNDPLSMLVGSYSLDVSNKATINILTYISTICSYCFVPFVSTVTPDVFDVEEFSQITQINLDEIHKNSKFKYLIEFATSANSNFVGLVIPRLFFPSLLERFHDLHYCSILGKDIAKYKHILGNGAFAFAAVIMNAFTKTGWFLDIVGTPPKELLLENVRGFGIVPSIKSQRFFEDDFPSSDIFLKYSTECFISEYREKALADLGFIPICNIKGNASPVFYSNGSVKNLALKVKQQELFDASTILQSTLCICRFAHYIKIIGRRKLGLFSNASEFQNYLNNWLLQYVSSDLETPLYLKHRYPLLHAKVEVSEDHFLKDNFNCKIYLTPHLISAQILTSITLTTKLRSITPA
jgi:type VI secretion system protein ImpD